MTSIATWTATASPAMSTAAHMATTDMSRRRRDWTCRQPRGATRAERLMADPIASTDLRYSREGRARAIRAGLRIEGVTVAWMIVEAIVAIGAGILARSVLLTAFGIDSVIELVTGCVLLW